MAEYVRIGCSSVVSVSGVSLLLSFSLLLVLGWDEGMESTPAKRSRDSSVTLRSIGSGTSGSGSVKSPGRTDEASPLPRT
jgi:hypothetical protein